MLLAGLTPKLAGLVYIPVSNLSPGVGYAVSWADPKVSWASIYL